MSPRLPLLLLAVLPLWGAAQGVSAAAASVDKLPDMGQPGALSRLAAAAQGTPEIPSAAQSAALPPQEFARQQSALKRVWLHRMACANAEQGRVSEQAEAECAGVAREWEAPEAMAEILQELAEGTAGGSHRHALQESLEQLLENYRIDALQIFYAVRYGNLSPEEAESLADMLPLPEVFNRSGEIGQNTVVMAADARTQARLLRDAAALLKGVNDAESADAALRALMPLLAESGTTLALRVAAAEGKVPESALTVPAMAEYEQALHLLREQQRRLEAADWHGCNKLKTVLFLLD